MPVNYLLPSNLAEDAASSVTKIMYCQRMGRTGVEAGLNLIIYKG